MVFLISRKHWWLNHMVTIVNMADFCNLKHSYQLKSALLRLASSSLWKRDQIYLNLLIEKSHSYNNSCILFVREYVTTYLYFCYHVTGDRISRVYCATLQCFSYHQMRYVKIIFLCPLQHNGMFKIQNPSIHRLLIDRALFCF